MIHASLISSLLGQQRYRDKPGSRWGIRRKNLNIINHHLLHRSAVVTTGFESGNMKRTFIKSKSVIRQEIIKIFFPPFLDCKKLLIMIGIRTSDDYIGEITLFEKCPSLSLSLSLSRNLGQKVVI